MIEGKFYCIDTHCHVFPEKVADKARDTIGGFYSMDSDLKATPEKLLDIGKKAKIDHFLIHSAATTPAQVDSINNYISGVVKLHPRKFTGLGTVHQDTEDKERVIKGIADRKLRGIKMHPDMQEVYLDDPRMMEIYELCGEYGLAVLLHTGDTRYDYSSPERLAAITKACPKTTFVGAHYGSYRVWDEGIKYLPDIENLYVDTSSTMFFLGTDGIRRLINAFGPDKIMFGTDFPLNNMKEEISALNGLGLKEGELEAIYSGNAKKVYNM